jgi:AraC family transcriptional regulator
MLEIQNPLPKRADTARSHSLAVGKVITAIRGNLGDNIQLSEMASLACMSPYHFNRTFRQVIGLPPRRYLGALRFEAAIKKLLETDSSIIDICMDVGYNSLGTFVRRFSDAMGMSPRRFRLFGKSRAKSLQERLEAQPNGAKETQPSVKGWIESSSVPPGPIFIGLFPNAIPEGTPVACTVTFQPGAFTIVAVPKGHYYLYAVALPWAERMDDYFNYDSALRGGGNIIHVNDAAVECESISLRPAVAMDAPILLNLPALLTGKLASLKAEKDDTCLDFEADKVQKTGIRNWRPHTIEEKRHAVECMKTCDNIAELARKHGVQRKLLYVWKHQIEGKLRGALNVENTYAPTAALVRQRGRFTSTSGLRS